MTTPANTARATTIPVTSDGADRPVVSRPTARTRRISTETKAAFKTTEFWVFIAMCVAVLIASMTVGSDSNATAHGGDYFRADKAWLYITILSVGYLLSRGIAKSGSRDFYDDEQDNQNK